ncbi:hypothetical protein [Thalassobellus suaedae]|uniref:Uncharacterized protein n=1 Tax=Thalassobellus suaedae TaxID=3074124 RepID=A0ABY9XQ38_9FLAO|nr:hypothetical protein RHP51_12625 [Flavobacteriaceae bacterium HL-DH14]WNH13343.1 hypothetical protein RHP49_03585 [Flavobacteriaceae bacterium HL-DH10]
MKSLKKLMLVIIIGTSITLYSQETEVSNEKLVDKKSYYQKRATEDAKYEQQFNAETKADEEVFWKDQKAYEDNLKRKDRKAYRAYMKGKKDAYANHYDHCNNHCHHSDYYYHHASFYYYRYNGYYYESDPRRKTISTRARVSTPNIKVGLGLF